MTRVTQLIHDAGKYLLISVYPLPTHPTHNFTHNNGGNLETLPGWPKKLQHNRPARSAGQQELPQDFNYEFLTLCEMFQLEGYQYHWQLNQGSCDLNVRYAHQLAHCIETSKGSWKYLWDISYLIETQHDVCRWSGAKGPKHQLII